jgi:hypothetical protein
VIVTDANLRAPSAASELRALVERLEQLIGAGYETIDVVFERPPRGLSDAHDENVCPSDDWVTRHDSGTATDANVTPLART